MILKKLTARFGKLNNDVLELHEGLNILRLPNEAGKSTWTEFLLAMLYGVDTGERKKAGTVPVKEKYRPWDGGEMAGSIELTADGRNVTIERSSTARAPMSKFQAFETENGLPVALDGSNCGPALVHAERSVYERSGFIRQQQLTVTQDAALEQKLASLVTTGDEDMAYSHVEQQLRALKNRCRHNKTGLLPEAEQAQAAAKAQLAQISATQESMADARAEQKKLLQERDALQKGVAVCAALENERRQARADETAALLASAQADRQRLAAQCALLPPSEELQALQGEIVRIRQAQRELAIRKDLAPQPPEQPTLPEALQDVPRGKIADKAAEDRQTCAELAATPSQAGRASLLIGLLLLAAGIALAIFGRGLQYLISGGVLALGVAMLVLFFVQNGKAKQRSASAQKDLQTLLRSYNATAPEDLTRAAQQADALWADYDEKLARQQALLDGLALEEDALLQQAASALAAVDVFGPKTGELVGAQRSVESALDSYAALASADFRIAQLKTTLDDRKALVGTRTPISDEDRARWESVDPMQLSQQLGRCEARLSVLQSALDQGSGRLSALGDRLALEAELDRGEKRIAELNQKNAALTLALEVLGEANRDLQSRFSPLVCQRAQELFSRLTGGRYERVLLSSDMAVSVQEPDAPVTRMLQLLSQGTVDQLYLALRLAISELLLPDAPLVLDDALVAFDDTRAKAALSLLKEEAEKRQILLFTCQEREEKLLKSL